MATRLVYHRFAPPPRRRFEINVKRRGFPLPRSSPFQHHERRSLPFPRSLSFQFVAVSTPREGIQSPHFNILLPCSSPFRHQDGGDRIPRSFVHVSTSGEDWIPPPPNVNIDIETNAETNANRSMSDDDLEDVTLAIPARALYAFQGKAEFRELTVGAGNLQERCWNSFWGLSAPYNVTENYYTSLQPVYNNSRTIVAGYINSGTMWEFCDAFEIQTRYYEASRHLTMWPRIITLHYNLCTIILEQL